MIYVSGMFGRGVLGALAAVLCMAAAPTASRAQDAATRARVAVLYQRSVGEYRSGHFREAADHLREAYALHPDPTLLYNLARAYEGLGDFQRAVDSYRSYLHAAPRIADRASIEARVGTLEGEVRRRRQLEQERLAERAARERAEAAAAREREQARARERERAQTDRRGDRSGPGAVPWIIGGGGIAVVAGGAIVGAFALARHDDAAGASSQMEAVDIQRDAESLGDVATGLFVAGAALVVAGAVWLLIDLTTSD